jgi:hypothetical protein
MMIDFELAGGGRLTVVGDFAIVERQEGETNIIVGGDTFLIAESAISIRERMAGRGEGYGRERSW